MCGPASDNRVTQVVWELDVTLREPELRGTSS